MECLLCGAREDRGSAPLRQVSECGPTEAGGPPRLTLFVEQQGSSQSAVAVRLRSAAFGCCSVRLLTRKTFEFQTVGTQTGLNSNVVILQRA